jgi:hypothetical protein
MPKTTLPKISDIKRRFNQFAFKTHEIFHWSPKDNTIYYDPNELHTKEGISQLLHEIGHALSNHKTYASGIQLVKIESEAWTKAREVAESYGLKISSKQIERCLDSYRDWLHIRSTCPNCETIALEVEPNRYHCFNCLQKWRVPSDQRTRHYRLKIITSK